MVYRAWQAYVRILWYVNVTSVTGIWRHYTRQMLSFVISSDQNIVTLCDVISEKGPYCGKKYRKPWSDVAHHARRLIRAFYICRLWASKGNIFLPSCAVLIKNYRKSVEIADLGRHCFISEKVPYCGRNSVFLDQSFPHFCDSIFYQKCAGSEKNVSYRCP